MAFAQMGASPFASLLGHLAGLASPGGPIPNPNMPEPPSYGAGLPVPVDVSHGFKNPGPYVPTDVRLGFKHPGLSQSFLPPPPVFPHPDPATAMAQIHQVLANHHNALQSLLTAITGLSHAPVGPDYAGHTQAGFHSQSTHAATVARRQGNNHPLPLQ